MIFSLIINKFPLIPTTSKEVQYRLFWLIMTTMIDLRSGSITVWLMMVKLCPFLLMFVLPIYLYASQAWNPHLQGDIDKIEKWTKKGYQNSKATRTGFEKLEYKNSLKRLSITTFQDRRIRGDLIETYKVLSNRESIDWVKTLNLRKNVDVSGLALSVWGKVLACGENHLFQEKEIVSAHGSLQETTFLWIGKFKLGTLFLTVLSLIHSWIPISRKLMTI